MNATTPAPTLNDAAGTASARPWLQSYPTECAARRSTRTASAPSSTSSRPPSPIMPNRAAVESFGTKMTYAELNRSAEAVASWLQSQGLKKGDRVAIMLPNVMAYPALMFGVLLAGGIVINVNPLYTARELRISLRIRARTLLRAGEFRETVQEAMTDVTLTVVSS